MDDKTKTMMLTLATGVIKKGLLVAGTSLAGHGIINSNQTETFVSVGMVLVGLGWSFWNDYGRAIVLSQLEVLKAKSLAQAAKLSQAGLPPVTTNQIAAQSPTLTSAEVAKTIDKMPPAIQANVVKSAVSLVAAFLVLGLFAPGNANAQSSGLPKLKPLTGNIGNDLGITTAKPPMITGNVEKDLQALWDKIVASSIADLNYAAAMAKSANTQTSGVRLQCINAIITLNQQASGANLKNADGTPMVKPDPHVFTDVESLAEVIDNLSPQGPLFVNCAGAAQLAKTNVLTFVNAVVTGAAGFAAMPIIPGL